MMEGTLLFNTPVDYWCMAASASGTSDLQCIQRWLRFSNKTRLDIKHPVQIWNKDQKWAVACYRAKASGFDPNANWICIDPVNLHIQGNYVILSSEKHFLLSENEADSLINSIQPHLADLNTVLKKITPSQWILGLPKNSEVETTDLSLVDLQSTFDFMPQGKDAALLKRLQSEIEMILMDHPVNKERAKQRIPEIRSVWFWGNGVFSPMNFPFVQLITDTQSDSAWKGLASEDVSLLSSKDFAENNLKQSWLVVAEKPNSDIVSKVAFLLAKKALKKVSVMCQFDNQWWCFNYHPWYQLKFWRKPLF